MEIQERKELALNMITEQRQELKNIFGQVKNQDDVPSAYERMSRWKERTVMLLSEQVNPIEANKLSKKKMMVSLLGNPIANIAREIQMYDSYLIALAESIANHPEDILDVPVAVTEAKPINIPQPTSGNSVFIIHGHDELNMRRLKDLLKERWGLDPIVMAKEPGKGRTLIEKFEDEAQRAVFAFGIMTPDDFVNIGENVYAQARPNVIFELGWFYGRLGRDRVCILLQEGTSIHTDLDGISRIQFQSSIEEKVTDIEKELVAAEII